MSDEPSSPPDLSAIDLNLSFAPAWAKEADSGDRLARLAARHGDGDRPERGGGKRRDDRGPHSDRRPPRRDGGGNRDRGASRDGRRDGGPRRDEPRPERAPQPITGWDVQFLPDKRGVDGLAKQIKTTAKAYPLFDLAQLVLEKSERYHVEFKRASETAAAIFQLKADGSLWLSEREAVAHALATQLDKFYRRERISVEPPKGVYACVAQCGMSGVLLGPPNYHDYQTKLIRLHAERFASVPFEVFKSRIRMVKDEESIAKWKEEQSSKEVFYPIDPSAPVKAPEAVVTEEAPPAAEPAEPAAEVVETASEEVASSAAEAAEIVESAEVPVAETPAEEGLEEPVAEVAEVATLRFDSILDVERHFRENHAATAVVQIRQRVIAPGSPVMNSSSPAVHLLARRLWEELRRFPLPLGHVLGQQLAARGVQIFKAHENITYVSVARPKYLDRQAAPVAAGLSGILDYLEANPKVPRNEQWKALLALRPVPAEGEDDQRETALAADLFWLLHEGHVVDYVKRNLEAARKPKPPTPKGASKKPAATAEPIAPTAAAEPEAPVVADLPKVVDPPAIVGSEVVAEEPVVPASDSASAPAEDVPNPAHL